MLLQSLLRYIAIATTSAFVAALEFAEPEFFTDQRQLLTTKHSPNCLEIVIEQEALNSRASRPKTFKLQIVGHGKDARVYVESSNVMVLLAGFNNGMKKNPLGGSRVKASMSAIEIDYVFVVIFHALYFNEEREANKILDYAFNNTQSRTAIPELPSFVTLIRCPIKHS